jgi:predicted Zn-dependent protease
MAFPVVCANCGAPSGPSVGVCPYCKSSLATGNADAASTADLQRMYNEGKFERALPLANQTYQSKPELRKDLSFMLLYAKILLNCEAPSSRVRSIMAEIYPYYPQHPDIMSYIEILEARLLLKKGQGDSGELMLKGVLPRSPENFHANFFLGTHYFWSDDVPMLAVPYLETCVRIMPNAVRAWGCLGAAYRKLGQETHAVAAFQKAMNLEIDQEMKKFFADQIAHKGAA